MVQAKDLTIALDDGHGMFTSGKRTEVIPSLGRYIPENEFNRAVVAFADAELKRLGFNTYLTAPTDADVPLNTRTREANRRNVDLFVSFHYNAITGKFATSKAEGFSVHIDPNASATTVKFAGLLSKHLSAGTTQKNRGIVRQNLAVTRDTKMPSALIEFGFMDNLREALLMINPAFQKECAVEVVKAICELYGIAYKADTTVAVKPVSDSLKKTPLLYLKDTGSSVTELQTILKSKGYSVTPDGIFGDETLKAVKKFQTDNKLEADGWVGEKTWEALLKKAPVAPRPNTPKPVAKPTMYRVIIDNKQVGAFSDTSNVVKLAQDAIMKGSKHVKLERV